jgi:hypothetical protein
VLGSLDGVSELILLLKVAKVGCGLATVLHALQSSHSSHCLQRLIKEQYQAFLLAADVSEPNHRYLHLLSYAIDYRLQIQPMDLANVPN